MINSIKASINGQFVNVHFDDTTCNQKFVKGYEFTYCWNDQGTEEIKVMDTNTGIYERFTIVSNGTPENITQNMVFTNINNYDQIEITEVNITISSTSYVWSEGTWSFRNPLKIIGTQHTTIASFEVSTVIDFPKELQTFFMAVTKGSFKFERKDGTYVLTLSN